MGNRIGSYDFLGKDLASTLTAWDLIQGDIQNQPESSSSREKAVLRAMHIVHVIGHDEDTNGGTTLSRDIISSLTSIRYRFKSAANTLNVINSIFKITSKGSSNIDTEIGIYRSKAPNWPNLSNMPLTVDQVSKNRVFLSALSTAYDKAVVLGQLPNLIDELSLYEEEFRWLDHNSHYTVTDYMDSLTSDMVREVIKKNISCTTLQLPHKRM